MNFTRIEDDPASFVRTRLRRSGYPFLLGIRCEMRDGVLIMAGTVPTFHLKQIAQELAAHTRGVAMVENRLEVTSNARAESLLGIDEAVRSPRFVMDQTNSGIHR